MSAISVRLPESLHRLARDIARQDQVSMNQFIATAIAEKVSALATEQYLNERAKRGSLIKFQAALAQVPSTDPAPFEK